MPWISIGALILLLALFNIPFLSSAFELSSISFTSYLAIFGIGYLTVSWMDILKIVKRIRSSL